MATQTGTFLWLFFAVFFVEVKSTTKHSDNLKILHSNGEYYEGPVKPSIQETDAHSDIDDESDEKNDSSDIPDFVSDSWGLDVKRQFDPWGGKRSSYNFPGQLDESIFSKRQFSPWGGKRGLPESKFYDEIKNEDDGGSSHVGKRNFHAWGGKRQMNPWSGKNSFGNLDNKRNFNAWGGKRSFNSWGGKKSFSSWGGKRSPLDWNERQTLSQLDGATDFDTSNSKKSFNSWGGKRNVHLPSRIHDFRTRYATSFNSKMP